MKACQIRHRSLMLLILTHYRCLLLVALFLVVLLLYIRPLLAASKQNSLRAGCRILQDTPSPRCTALSTDPISSQTASFLENVDRGSLFYAMALIGFTAEKFVWPYTGR